MGSEREINAAERQKQVLELRKAGFDFRRIAEATGYSGPSGAYKAYRTALKAIYREPAIEALELELTRLDDAQAAIWPAVRRGDLQAINTFLRISERRAKVTGIEAPQRVEVTQVPREAAAAIAADFGLNADEVIAEAERIVRDHGTRNSG